MRKSLLFRSLSVFLAAATLLSSTSAYNLLVYANQEIESSSLSASNDESYEPNISVQGGDLIVESTDIVLNGEESNGGLLSWGTDANGNPADGSQQNPYQISSLEHLLLVDSMVNDTTGSVVSNPDNKYFVLTADIDISSVSVNNFINSTGNAYLVSTDYKNPDSNQSYIHLDGSYVDENGVTQRHKITGGTSGWNIEIAGHQNFSLFGYLSAKSVIQNVIFENINVNVTVNNFRQVAIVSNKNDGLIQNCSIDNCTISASLTNNHSGSYYINDGVYFYNGIAGAVADNAGTVENVTVNNFALTLKGEEDYIGAVAAQNRGLINNTSVSGIKVSATAKNYYIGGIAGYNEPDSTSLGIKNCQVDLAGENGTVKNFTNGAYVGGLVGSNDGYLYNSSVTGTFTSSDETTAASYNMLGNVSSSSESVTYYGGAAGISTGLIQNVTVSDFGFYYASNTKTKRMYFGGIASTVKNADSIVSCVSTGTFSAQENTNAYAGGVIAYAADDIADGAISNTYTLFKIDNPTQDYVGAVIGAGGKASTLTNCYWSDYISGCATSYVQYDTTHSSLIAGADALTGNLVSGNKAVVAVRNSSVSFTGDALNQFTHIWEGSSVSFSLPQSDISVPTNATNNSLTEVQYPVSVNFGAAGASDKSVMNVGMHINAVITTAKGDPDSIEEPMEITSSAQAKFLYLIPYGHFIIKNNISVSSSVWEAPLFNGTINGNGKTVSTDTPLFKAVIGSRTGSIGSALDSSSYITNPADDNASYLRRGYISQLNVDLADNITSSIFGSIINATFVNVSLTDGDEMEDDGNKETFEGFYATFSSRCQATFASSANGYSYIYGCSTNVSAYVSSDDDDQALFIAKLSGETTVDNCNIHSNLYIDAGIEVSSGRAAFIGNIAENRGYILNSIICTRIDISSGVGGRTYVVFGNISLENNYGKYKNIVWSKNVPEKHLYPMNGTYDNTQVTLWGAVVASDGTFTYPKKIISSGVAATFNVTIPANIKAFEAAKASDFTVIPDGGAESAFEVVSASVENGVLKFVVRAKENTNVGSQDYIRIYHRSSGLTTFVNLEVANAGLVYNEEDGFYHITTSSDIKFIADNYAKDNSDYADAAYILDNDIDMTGVTVRPIGSPSVPFTGIFTCPVDENGTPLYTISNLTVESSGDNSALFGVVDFSGADLVLGTENIAYERGISNISINTAFVKGANNVAVLVGYAGHTNTANSLYKKVNINNVIIKNAVITAGVDTTTGKTAAAVIACADNANLNISGVVVENVEIKSFYNPTATSPTYFTSKYEHAANYSGGIGAVAGVINETYRGYGVDSAMQVNISNVDVSSLNIRGTNAFDAESYVPVNAGGVVGTYFTQYVYQTAHYPLLKIGASGESYGVNVKDIVILSKGNAGGILGASNVKTTIDGAHVYGSADASARINAKTDYFVGGIAGYIGSKISDSNAYDSAPLDKVYGAVNNCLVDNVEVKAILTSESQLTRNVTVGGAVGAINGNIYGNAVANTTVKNSHVEGIIVGGIVGSSIDTNGARGNILDNNSVNIDSCEVRGSHITTISGAIPAEESNSGWLNYGVGGILGTNRRTLYSFAQHTTVQRCYVDKETVITNNISGSSVTVGAGTSYETASLNAHAATGGILGAGFENGDEAGALVIKNNEVYASIVSKENYISGDTAAPNQYNAFYKTFSATGGLVGALIGRQYDPDPYFVPSAYEACDLSKVSIMHGIFGGSILGTDGIGGAVGVIACATAFSSDNPTNLLSDIAVTGEIESVLDDSVYRGGVVIGHIAFKSDGADSSGEAPFYAFDVAAGTDITTIFNKIYFTSFGLDTAKFSIFSYHNAPNNATVSYNYSPLAANAKAMLINCYEDVNMKDDNTTLQFNDVESAETYILPAGSYPLATRPVGENGAYTVSGQQWYSSNRTIATVISTGPNDLTIEPNNSGTISVMINYVGTVGDGTWSAEAYLPAGFRFKSNNQNPLDYVTVDGVNYYLITTPNDFAILGKNMEEGSSNQGSFDAAYMALNYWLAGDIEFTEEMFATDGFYDGGFITIGSTTIPFTGTLSSMPEGTFTSNGGTTYNSTGYYTISGLKLKSSGTHMGLFACVNGAVFENFAVDGFTAQGADTTTYLGTLAAVITNNVTVDNVSLSNINLTGADYTGGFFGGTLYKNNTAESSLTDVSVTGKTDDDVYSNIIGAEYGAAGIIAHTSQYNTNITNVVVQDAQITQESATADNLHFDYGAAGVAMAYSGAISVNGSFRNKIDNCKITGEVAAGVVMRSYTSTSATAFANKTNTTVSATVPAQRADKVEINAVDVVASKITGTHVVSTTTALSMSLQKAAASAGILARVDTAYKQHNITDCVVDSDTYVSALVAAAGIVGCIESPGSNTTTYSNIPYYLTVDGCESYATVEMTEPTRVEIKNAIGSSTSLYNSGASAIFGCIGRYNSNINIRIRNSIAGGIIRGNGAIGGIIGASWSDNTYSKLNAADGHMIENCTVSAKLETPNGDGTYVSAFSAERMGAGLIIGNIFEVHMSTSIYVLSYTENNYPFYNIYLSDVNYADDNYVYLYGTNLSSQKLHSLTNTTYGDTYTKYIYNLNRTGSFSIDTTTHVLTFSKNDSRIYMAGDNIPASEKYLYKLNYNNIKVGEFEFSTNTFGLNTVVNDNDKNKYLFETGAAVNGFTVSANTGEGAVTADNAKSTEFVLESITSSDKRIRFEATDSTNTQFRVISEVLTGGVSGKMYFNYSNGLTLAIDLEIEIKPEDFWFKTVTLDDGTSKEDLLIFNAANLSYVRRRATATSVITQCYDVYWTVSDSAVIAAANAAVAEKTLADVYTDEFINEIAAYSHPNPFYDGTAATKPYVTFDEMFSTTEATRGAVLLKELVGTIALTEFSVYGEAAGASIYSNEEPFAGTYQVEKAVVASGLTSADESYKIYGLELQSNITAKNDYPNTGSAYTGMFNRIGAGATVSNITFVNPVINTFVESSADNFVGVLAGDIAGEGTTVTNISVIGSNNDTNRTSYVINTRDNVAANSYVGAIAGNIGVGTVVDNVTVTGVDVVGAGIASNSTSNENSIKRVYAGGVAGSSEGTITNVTVDANVLVNRYQVNGYIAYAGGVAGKASGTINGVNVSALVSGCDVEENSVTTDDVERGYITYSENPTSDTGDRLGGVTGLVDGSITINDVKLSGITVNAFDIAGGVVAEIANDENISVVISSCNFTSDSDKAAVTITGTNNYTGKASARWLYNAAGGVVGLVDNLASLEITDCDFEGYIGQYEISQRECTSGGIIALVGEKFTSFDKLSITGSTVQGEVQGYRRQSTQSGANERIYGAAGGLIGKIYNYAEKTNSNDVMISNCIMSARVDLYLGINRTAKADYSSLENLPDTNVGKIIGELRSGPENFAFKASAADESKVSFINYVKDVYISSYPQNIVAYGSSAFYSNTQNDPKDTYIDINKEYRYTSAEDVEHSEVSSFMVDGTIADPSSTPDNYNTNTYSDVAIITFDKESQGTEASRYFRLAYDKLNFYSDKVIEFSGNFAIAVDDESADLGSVTVNAPVYSGTQLLTETVKGEEYKYYPGVITLRSDENIDIVGYISAKYSYGLEAGIQFVSMEIKGNGSQATPFEVAEPKHFKVVRALRGAYYKQVNNIDFASADNNQYNASNPDALFATGKGIEPIGKVSAPFTGEYDGFGYVLSNVYIARPDESNVGFFGYIGTGEDMATLKNIHIELASNLEISDEDSQITTVSGGITGAEAVGGLVGYAKNASITNCSVANGFVVGKTKVGGLVGCTGLADFDSCFTSTSTYSSVIDNVDGSTKNVGALVGYVTGKTIIDNSFTLGLVSVGTTSDKGVAGGFVGYADSGSVTIQNALVGATVSNYTSIQDANGEYKYMGLTVGQASPMADVEAKNVTVSATVTFDRADSTRVNPVLGGATGASVSNIKLDSGIVGDLNLPKETKESYTLLDSEIDIYEFSTGSTAAGDEYTAAYAAIAVIPVNISNQKEVENRSIYTDSGLFYPVILKHGGGYTFTSSAIEETDIEYPEYLDVDLYGNVTASGNDKNTDLLFKDADGSTTVYPNSYPVKYDSASSDPKAVNSRKAVLTDGTFYSNGEIAYDTSLPYFTVSKTVNIGGSELEIARKVVYPRQIRADVYPIATARQFFALTNADENNADSKYYDSYTVTGRNSSLSRNYVVVADIDLDKNNFVPVTGYKGEFDGNDYTVDNLVIRMPGASEVGLFRTLGSGKIRNLTLGIYHIQGADNVGGLVGAVIKGANEQASVIIQNCHTVLSEGGIGIDASGRNVGGLIGAALSNSSVLDESSSAVTVKGKDIVGGLIGYCEMSVKNSYSTGAVNASFTASNAATQVKMLNAGGSTAETVTVLNHNNEGTEGGQHGIGGLIGVLANSTRIGASSQAKVEFSFSSGIVTVTDAAYLTNGVYGVGGLVGINHGIIGSTEQATILTSFSSGNVYYCYGNENLNSLANVTLGVGGLVGVLCETLNDVYSSASVAADLGSVENAKSVGVGGVVGIAYDTLTSAYSSGSTLSTTTTAEEVYINCNYGKGGVIGLLDSNRTCSNLRFDLNLSILKDEVGKVLSGGVEGDGENSSSGPVTTKEFTSGSVKMSENFGYTENAYPYLKEFFKNTVSQTVRINALLSIVALQLNELDTSAANGNGISMALNIPTGVRYDATGEEDSANEGLYTYGYTDNNNLVDAAQGVIDEDSHTLSIQRTVNEAQYVNFVVSIESKDGSLKAEDGTVYSQVANRLISRLCAPMLGSDTHPYLVATQEDLNHVGLTNSELNDSVYTYGMYKQWATPITETGAPKEGKIHFRLMGYVPLNENYSRTIEDLTKEVYTFTDSDPIAYQGISFNGNGYSIRNLNNRLFDRLDEKSELSNMSFTNVSFNSTSLIGTVDGDVTGVNVYGTASGSNTAAIANTVAQGGTITGAVADVDYTTNDSVINVAGIAVENNGTISMSASVGNFTGGLFTNLGALAAVNNGVINNSFTIGNIRAEDADNLGGFVNKNSDSGSITNCYTRCNIIVSGNQGDEVVASFAAHNSGKITNAYSSGLLKLANAIDLYSVFVADNTVAENLKNCMFDKQMSGSQFKDVYKLAERTKDIINLTFHSDMITVTNGDDNRIAYKVIEDTTANNPYDNYYYPQLSAILNTAVVSENASEEEIIKSRMYSVLRAYSFISSAMALVANDNYIDNLGYKSMSTLSYDSVNNNMWTETSGSSAASVGTYNESGNNVGKYISAAEQQNVGNDTGAVFTASYAITDFYGNAIKVNGTDVVSQLDLFVNVTAGNHPNFAGGNGSADSRFEISTAEEFIALSFYGSNDENNFIIVDDIDMKAATWDAYIENFKADLDGNNKSVRNITIGESGNDSLFGKIDGGKIANLGIAGIDVTVTGSEGGMLASTATGGALITNTYVVGTLTASSGETTNVGGFVGNADNVTIDGCVVSGKLDSKARVTGGVVGSALDGSVISNTLSTVYVNGAADGTAAGIAGTASSGVTLTNCVFASDVKAGTAGNIVGDGRAVDTCYYDKQMTSVTDEANGVSTHYLTSGATMQQLGFVDEQSEPTMTRIDGFNGYPVPVGMVSGSEFFCAGLKFASAKINLASGVGAGTLNSFTTVTAEPSLDGGVSAELNFGSAETVSDYYLVKPEGTTAQINTDTSKLALGLSAERYITYTTSNVFDSDKMLRYLDVNIGKALKVKYNYTGLSEDKNAVLTVYSGMNNASAVTAFAVSGKHSNQLLSSSMIVPYDSNKGAYILRVGSELPDISDVSELGVISVDVVVNNNGSPVSLNVDKENLTDGTWMLALTASETNPIDCDEIIITINVGEVDTWGVHEYFNLF